MFTTTLDIVISGLLMGGIYALIAMGLSLQYGVARVLNISHGEFIMLGAFTTWALYTGFGVNPLASLAIVGPITFVIGFILYRTLFTRLRNTAPSPAVFEGNSLLAAFGLLFVIQNAAFLVWGPEIHGYTYLAFPVNILGAVFGANRLVTLGFSVGIGLGFYLFLTYTRLGKAIRSAGQDSPMAGLMGINVTWVLALCFGLGAAMAGFGGTLLSMCYTFTPVIGLEYTIIAIIVVVLGGLGSIPGSFIGGFILGIIGSIVTYYQPSLTLVAYYAIFIILLLIRPTGIMGK